MSFRFRKVHDEAQRPVGTGFAACLEQVAFGILVQILLVERRRIQGVEDLPDFAQPDLDEGLIALLTTG
jgi:hypothetical protein